MNILKPPLPKPNDTIIHWGELYGSAKSLAILKLAEQSDLLVVITPDTQSANQLHIELEFFKTPESPKILQFPDWETLAYDYFSPHPDIISERLLILHQLPLLKTGILIVALPSLMHRVAPKEFVQAHSLVIKQAEVLNLSEFQNLLEEVGYRRCNQVLEHGEYALRGAILDIFLMGSQLPYRIELLDTEISSIRHFDPETQRSLEKLESIELLPAHEFPLNEQAITHFREQWRAEFSGNPTGSAIYQNISEGKPVAGIEYYLPLFYSQLSHLLDYINPKALIVQYSQLTEAANRFYQEVGERYEQLRHNISRPLCPPKSVFIAPEELFSYVNQHTKIMLHEELLPDKANQINFASLPPPNLLIGHKAEGLDTLKSYLEHNNGQFLFCAETTGRREVLQSLLKSLHIKLKTVAHFSEFLESGERFGLIIGGLSEGLVLKNPSFNLITEAQLFGAQVMQRRLRKPREPDNQQFIRNLNELKIDDPIVHFDHGVGRYQGLETIETQGSTAEYLKITYANDDKIYVPISSLHLISRYTGLDAKHAPLQRLGSKQWDKAKEAALKRIHDVAVELLEIYGKRAAAQGHSFKIPTADYLSFKSAFAFEGTPDQEQTIQAVLNDMQKSQPMDRLVCGDVGFGKTEVAMRAAFIAVQNSKQVAVLVPTTLLATQHAQSFKDRFADWPIKVACLSRFSASKETKQILEDLQQGKIDIVVGTHKLLQADIQFKDLGLLVVDEEHRFGVRQKEKIKTLRAQVDILTLTATPIPRTLNMAMAGMRDLSIIATPPLRRLSIKTFTLEYNPAMIREALLREIMRGGQVYFLHNDIATIEQQARRLQEIMPTAKIAIGHGQMSERELERVMSDFYHQKYNILISTTIIESGIDIPSANTIIINRADKFGLAQLHQLRGRVGRSHHQAYAYLIVPPHDALTTDAVERLEAITEHTELGSGFNLASQDLEIRGAGELLGAEQSGQIEALGFTLFMELLDEAVNTLKQGKELKIDLKAKAGPEIELGITALLPGNYVNDIHARLQFYKRLANTKSSEEINEIEAELIDRYGLMPPEALSLLKIAELKLQVKDMKIHKIECHGEFGYLYFAAEPKIKVKALLTLIQSQAQDYQLQGPSKLRFRFKRDNDRLEQIQALLDLLR